MPIYKKVIGENGWDVILTEYPDLSIGRNLTIQSADALIGSMMQDILMAEIGDELDAVKEVTF